MNSIDSLVEQHFRESQSHLKHIDELMARASEAPEAASPGLQGLMRDIRTTRATLAGALDTLQEGLVNGSESDPVTRIVSLKTELQSAGTQFERALTAIFDLRGLS